MKPEFVEFATQDKLTLPGLLYRAKGNAVAIFLHGNGSSSVFYDAAKKHVLAPFLAKKGISILYFNNRGAHIIKKLYQDGEPKRFGMAYELIRECVLDIDAAIGYLAEEGFSEFYLIGESTGANKICVYNHYKENNEVSKYVLVCGGDDTGIYYEGLGKELFWKLLKESQKRVEEGSAQDIVPQMLPGIMSYKALADIADPNGDYNVFPFMEKLKSVKLSSKPLFRYYKEVDKPSLVVYGSEDEHCYGDVPKIVGILKEQQPGFDYRIIEGADHRFSRHREELARKISDWL